MCLLTIPRVPTQPKQARQDLSPLNYDKYVESDSRQIDGMGDEPTINGEVVALLRLPIKIRSIDVLFEALQDQYGEGLHMQQQGHFLAITRPEETDRQ